MSTADGGRVLEFEGTALNDLPQFAQILEDQLRRLFDLEGLCCIHDIIRRETVMQPPRLPSDLLRDSRGKGNYVMLDLGLDLPDPFYLECAAFSNRLRRRLRHDSGFSQSFAGGCFHCQPHAEFIFITPDPAHFRPGIARDQGLFLTGVVRASCKTNYST